MSDPSMSLLNSPAIYPDLLLVCEKVVLEGGAQEELLTVLTLSCKVGRW